jgi:hypothetical protein
MPGIQVLTLPEVVQWRIEQYMAWMILSKEDREKLEKEFGGWMVDQPTVELGK